ncbi:MAG: terminase large subunit [Nanoarchaeota archaeon]|nr:terminase large subunit [Nanoarchaeota archaeon]
MNFQFTTATRKIREMRARIRAVPGGTSASKTISILLHLIDLAQSDKNPTLTSIVSESFPHLRRGAMRDFLNIMIGHGYFKDRDWSKSDSIYNFETGSKIEFFSADQPDKLRGGRRDRLFLNEANNVTFDAFEQLEVRTKDFIFLDWNPSSEFYYYTDVKGKRNDVEEVTLTYLDNEALDKRVVDSIEQRKNRKGWWQVYGLGQLGEVEGKIYKGWEILDELPKEAKLLRYGLDFGFSADASACVACYGWNGGFIFDEIFYQKGLSNRQIADLLKTQEDALVVADSSEPKSIVEISDYGILIKGAVKGQGSVTQGIQFVQDQKSFMTKRSVNVIREYRNYLWQTDREGKIINVPEHAFSHSMDSIRYALQGFDDSKKNNNVEYMKAVTDFLDNPAEEGRIAGFRYEEDEVLASMEKFI